MTNSARAEKMWVQICNSDYATPEAIAFITSQLDEAVREVSIYDIGKIQTKFRQSFMR